MPTRHHDRPTRARGLLAVCLAAALLLAALPASTVAAAPDLVPATFTAPSTASPKQLMSISWTVQNVGDAQASSSLAWVDRIYLSDDAVLNVTTDLQIHGQGRSTPLAPGASYTVTASPQLPSSTTAGLKHLFLVTDADGRIAESNETNNVVDRTITVLRADLVPVALTAPSATHIGVPITISWTVSNEGTGPAASAWTDSLYLSHDALVGNDILLANIAITSSVAAGGSYTRSSTFTLPSNLPLGEKFLLVRVDTFGSPGVGEVPELNDANNALTKPISITAPDLRPTSLIAPADITIEDGSAVNNPNSFSVTATVVNDGTGAVPSTLRYDDAFYLSFDAQWDSSDEQITRVSHTGGVAVGGSYTFTVTLTPPWWRQGGPQYLLLKADGGVPAVSESNEQNNVLAVPILVRKPDLAPTNLLAPPAAQQGTTVTATWTITNAGDGLATFPWIDSVYLSDDTRLGDSNDRRLRDVTHQADLAAGSSYTQSAPITIPTTVTSGTKYLLVRTDGGDLVHESNEDNNVLVIPITIGNAAPTASANGPYSVAEGGAVVLTGSGSDPDGQLLVVRWDLDNNGSFETSGASVSFSALGRNGPDSQLVALQVCDPLGSCDTDTTTIDITNVAPAVTITDAPASSLEGTPLVLGSHVDDPGASETLTYHWSVTKNGEPYAEGGEPGVTLTPDDNGVYVATLGVGDGIDEGSQTVTIDVRNVAPTGTLENDGPVAEGGQATVSFSDASDPSSVDTTASMHYAFACDGGTLDDASYATSGAEAVTTCGFADDGAFQVRARVIDKDGGYTEYTTTVTVTNVDPTPAISGLVSTSPEGTTIELDGVATDPGADGLTYSWRVTKDTAPYATGAGTEFSFLPDDNGQYVVTLTVTDEDGGHGVTSAAISVESVAPTAVFEAPSPVDEGAAFRLILTDPSDPSPVDQAAGYRYAFDCGDGNGYGAFGEHATASCSTTESGTRTVRSQIMDKDGGITEYTGVVVVTNAAPTITSLTPTPAVAVVGAPVPITGVATDPSSADVSAGFTWAWAVDGASFAPGANPTTVTFATCGVHTVSATATDRDGAVSPVVTTSAISVSDASFQSPLTAGVYNTVQKGRVIPVKITVGCNGTALTGLTPAIQLLRGDVTPETESGADPVETLSSSAADTTGVMRAVEDGYYYNLQVPSDAGATVGALYTIRVRPFGNQNPAAIYVVLQIKK